MRRRPTMYLEGRLCFLVYDHPPRQKYGLHADAGPGDAPHAHRHDGDEDGRRGAPGDNHHRGGDNAHEGDIRHEGVGKTDHEKGEDTHHEADDNVGGDTRNRRRKRGEGIHGEGDDAEEEGKNHPDTRAHDEDPCVPHGGGTHASLRLGTRAHGKDTPARNRRDSCRDMDKDSSDAF